VVNVFASLCKRRKRFSLTNFHAPS
jgi:hypothetical protein